MIKLAFYLYHHEEEPEQFGQAVQPVTKHQEISYSLRTEREIEIFSKSLFLALNIPHFQSVEVL